LRACCALRYLREKLDEKSDIQAFYRLLPRSVQVYQTFMSSRSVYQTFMSSRSARVKACIHTS
jgi:hypothetical protein